MTGEITEAKGFLYENEFYTSRAAALREKVRVELGELIGTAEYPILVLMQNYEKAISILNQMYNAEDGE